MAITGPISGTQGKVLIATNVIGYDAAAVFAVGLIRQFNADIRRDVQANETFDTTGNFKRKIGGMYDIAGTCQGYTDAVKAFELKNIIVEDFIPASSDNIELVVRAGSTNLSYTFDAIISNVNMQVIKGSELNAFTLTFESTGAIVATHYTA
jgi:hypothetical protein